MVETGREVCSTREAADRLGVSLRTVQLWSEAGLLRAWKTPGGHRRILTTSIDELLQRRTAVTARRPSGGTYQVLIVEDEPDFRQLFELHLRSWEMPIHLQSVPSGFDALLQIGASKPDLLVTDLRMPGIDGFEMLRALRTSGAISELEIIVVTALTEHTIAERGGLPPGVTVLYKPLRFAELKTAARPAGRALAARRCGLTWHRPARPATGATSALLQGKIDPIQLGRTKPMANDPVVILSARRTPIGAMLGAFASVPGHALGATAIRGALESAGADPGIVNEVVMGCVLPAGQGQAPARQAALAGGVPRSVPTTTVNKMCGSGMRAVMYGADHIAAGSADFVLAGGLESMTNAPYLLPKARAGYRMGHGEILDHMFYDGLAESLGRQAHGLLRRLDRGEVWIQPR